MRRIGLLVSALLIAAGALLLWRGEDPRGAYPTATRMESLAQGVARMDSPAFRYDAGWVVSSLGADTLEPADPWAEPSGRMAFTFTGRALDMQLAVGDYWGYLFVTVNGQPANQLARIPGNVNSRGEAAGYRPFLAPERQTPDGPATLWVPIHRAGDEGPHRVEVEVWRSWGQTPLRAVAVDATPPTPFPRWPLVAVIVLGIGYWVLGIRDRGLGIGDWGLGIRDRGSGIRERGAGSGSQGLDAPRTTHHVEWGLGTRRTTHHAPRTNLPISQSPNLLLILGMALVALGVASGNWLVNNAGLLLLGLAGLLSPWRWVAALLFALPFYLLPLPILPGRSLNLIEVGVWGGVGILGIGYWILGIGDWGLGTWTRRTTHHAPRTNLPISQSPNLQYPLILLLALAFILVFHAEQQGVALREWRTIFLAAGGFGLLLAGTLAVSPPGTLLRLVWFWLLGGTVIGLVAIGQYASGQMLIEAEGVERVRGFYGSPNNLALYLERTAAVGLALALFGRGTGIGDRGSGTGDWGLGTRRTTHHAPRTTHHAGLDTPGKLPPGYSTDASSHAPRTTHHAGLDTPGKLPPGHSTDASSHAPRTTHHAGLDTPGKLPPGYSADASSRAPRISVRTLAWALTLPQLAALLLTFSKGALFLALPAILAVLGMGGIWLLRRRGSSLRGLWGLAAVAGGIVLGLLPFLGTERFQLLFDLSAGSTGGLRLNLWRSSLAMALDHPWLGVGPDNFLYAYRSGYILPAAWQDPSLNHPHNVLLDWWTRLGLGGVILAGGWLIQGVRARLSRPSALNLGFLAAIAAGLAHGLIDASYALPDLMLVWVLVLGGREVDIETDVRKNFLSKFTLQ